MAMQTLDQSQKRVDIGVGELLIGERDQRSSSEKHAFKKEGKGLIIMVPVSVKVCP